jgi:glc operon protein GlcG
MYSRQTIGLREAEVAARAGHDYACAAGWAVTIAIVDDAGAPVLVSRMDRASPASIDTAIEKSRSSALTGLESKVLEEFVRQRPGVGTLKRVAVEGGVPILVDGERVGGIGVSGVLSDQDAEIAKIALETMMRELAPPV